MRRLGIGWCGIAWDSIARAGSCRAFCAIVNTSIIHGYRHGYGYEYEYTYAYTHNNLRNVNIFKDSKF